MSWHLGLAIGLWLGVGRVVWFPLGRAECPELLLSSLLGLSRVGGVERGWAGMPCCRERWHSSDKVPAHEPLLEKAGELLV